MFGCCVAGRPLQTNMTQVDETHAYFELISASTINHICVFLLGDVLFPEGYGATVHFLWPGKGSQLLGMISNDKPSAVFRVKSTSYASSDTSAAYNRFSVYSTPPTVQNVNVTAILGLSVEPIPAIQEQITALQAFTGTTPGSELLKNPAVLAERIVKHLINYISGFTGGAALNSNMMIPVSLIERWYETFMRKLQTGGVGFLERGE